MEKRGVLWITRTAAMIALLVVMQAVIGPWGGTILTGSAVNLILIISVLSGGFGSGAAVAVVSPVLAKLFGIGPLWSLIPCIAAGNLVLVSIWHYIAGRNKQLQLPRAVCALVLASAAKCLTLYVGIVKIMVPLILRLPESQAAVISNLFSLSQLVTACLGGAGAIILWMPLQKAIARRQS